MASLDRWAGGAARDRGGGVIPTSERPGAISARTASTWCDDLHRPRPMALGLTGVGARRRLPVSETAEPGVYGPIPSLTQPREETRRWAAHIVDESPAEQYPRRACLRTNEEV